MQGKVFIPTIVFESGFQDILGVYPHPDEARARFDDLPDYSGTTKRIDVYTIGGGYDSYHTYLVTLAYLQVKVQEYDGIWMAVNLMKAYQNVGGSHD